MYPKIEFKNGYVHMLRCPSCNNALGINPLVINQCDKCKTKIEHKEDYVQDWQLFCGEVLFRNYLKSRKE